MTTDALGLDWPTATPASDEADSHAGEVEPSTQRAAVDVLYREAALLDGMDLTEWLELFTDDALYWVPLVWLAGSPIEHLNLIYDDRSLLTDRVQRLLSGDAYSQSPPSRTCRSVSNSRLMRHPHESEALVVRSIFRLDEVRGDDVHSYAGRYTHVLRSEKRRLRIARKRVDLLTCDQVLPNLSFLL